jgi:hypothetical protein
MTTFTIDCDNNITVFASLQEAQAADLAEAEYFSSEEELAQLAASWPVAGARGRGSSKLMELWNSLPGVTPVKKFKDRQTALARIWKAARALTAPECTTEATVGAQARPDAPKGGRTPKKATKGGKRATAHEGEKKRKAPKTTSAKKAAPARKGAKKASQGGNEARDGSKKAEVLELMRRPKGATLQEIMKATGWQAHTVRGFVSGTLIKKQGLKVESFRNNDKERTYRVSA